MEYSTDSEYWNGICNGRVTIKDGKTILNDNTDKKRILLVELLKRSYANSNVLEIGTGLGNIAASMATLYMGAMKYIGHDISEQFIKVARELGLHVVNSRATKLYAPDSSCDFVWAFDTLEHIHPDERDKTYAEIGRVIKKGGIVVVNSPLMVSFHADYDYGFSEKDSGRLMEIAELRRVKRKVLTYNELDDSMRAYMYEELESCK